MNRSKTQSLAALAAVTAFVVPVATATGSGGVAACAADNGATPAKYAPVTSPLVTQDDAPPPGPMAGPNSRHDWGSAKNNGGDLVGFCELRP